MGIVSSWSGCFHSVSFSPPPPQCFCLYCGSFCDLHRLFPSLFWFVNHGALKGACAWLPTVYWFSLYLILDSLYLLSLYLSMCTFSVFTWWCKTLLQKSLPMLRQSMQLGRMSIDGIRPPPHEVVITTTTSQATPATVHRPQIAAQPTAIVRPALVGLVLIAFCVCVVIVYCQQMIVEHCLE